MRIFFITDIHGNHYPMMKLLEKAKFNPMKDILIFGGDMIDRGPDSGLVIKEVKKLTEEYPSVKAVIGNHEEMSLWFFTQQSQMWHLHGGQQASDSFDREFKDSDELIEHLMWMSNLPIVWEDDDYIFTHAGLNEDFPLLQQPRKSLWITQMEFHSFRKELLLDYTNGRKVIHGHTPTKSVLDDGARISCDLGASVLEKGQALALVDLTNNEFYKYNLLTNNIRKYQIKKINSILE